MLEHSCRRNSKANLLQNIVILTSRSKNSFTLLCDKPLIIWFYQIKGPIRLPTEIIRTMKFSLQSAVMNCAIVRGQEYFGGATFSDHSSFSVVIAVARASVTPESML